MELKINGKTVTVTASPDTPILWALRDELNLTGTKFGCGMSLCGACTIHLDGEPTRSCVTPIAAAQGKSITTIEGIPDGGERDPGGRVGKAVQSAWIELSVPQCGYCQSGQIMAATALLVSNKQPSDSDIEGAMSGNICRCGTYQRIKGAILKAAKSLT